jgi:hypothetical protein
MCHIESGDRGMQMQLGGLCSSRFVVGFATLLLAVLTVLALAPSRAHAQFDIAAFDQQITADQSGDAFSQAGGHPYEITTDIELKSHPAGEGVTLPDEDPKDIITELPPGLVGNPTVVAQCTSSQLAGANEIIDTGFHTPECPIASQVGTVAVKLVYGTDAVMREPVYNLVPPSDEPASFGFVVLGVPITLYGTVRNGRDHGIDVISSNIPNTLPLRGIEFTFWGIPADPSHDSQRCSETNGLSTSPPYVCEGVPGTTQGPQADPEPPRAFLTLPGSCPPAGAGLRTVLQADSWEQPGVFVAQELFSHRPPGFPLAPSEWGAQLGTAGCEILPFAPSISIQPTNQQADTPSGLDIDIAVPQDGLLNATGIATANVEKAVVTLPPGEAVSPSAADGLGGCSLAQIGLHADVPATCPDSSKLGTLEIFTPLLAEPMIGSIFLGKQGENPFNSLIALYLVAEQHGVIIKLAGHVDLDPVTGRITTTFDNNPQLAFDRLRLHFKPGPRSPLVNPHLCGSYNTTAEFTPWSGTAPVTVQAPFEITSGPQGSPCPGLPQKFAPAFAAGTINNQAGAYSPMTMSLARADGEQQLGGLSMTLPPGLLGKIADVPLCPEPQASLGTCGAASQVGTFTVGAGAGANPFYVYTGKLFFTGSYKGGEYGLSITVPAVAGPFDLGTVVVRASITLDPVTTALTIKVDPLPTILQGIPLDLRAVNVSVDRPNFVVNPTNCNPLSLNATLEGGEGSTESTSSKFQVTNCGRLGFAPRFTVSTPSHTSRARGAGLKAKIVYPKTPQANIAKVKVSLPKQLPSRLTTLQKACPDSVFKTNPSNCPAGSRIGTAKAITPILPEPLRGPVYFVSHGGAAFPDLTIALQGYGVTFNLIGTTFISKAGITSTSFKQVPDVPIGSFELTLPQGPSSALAANGNLCASKLKMPTAFIAQDGAEIHQATPIAVTGCSKHKAKKAKKASRRSRRK